MGETNLSIIQVCDGALLLLPASSKRSGGAGGEEGDQETFVQKGKTEVEMTESLIILRWLVHDPGWKYDHGCHGDQIATLQPAAF